MQQVYSAVRLTWPGITLHISLIHQEPFHCRTMYFYKVRGNTKRLLVCRPDCCLVRRTSFELISKYWAITIKFGLIVHKIEQHSIPRLPHSKLNKTTSRLVRLLKPRKSSTNLFCQIIVVFHFKEQRTIAIQHEFWSAKRSLEFEGISTWTTISVTIK